MRKGMLFGLALTAAVAAAAGDPRVENVRARQIPDTKDVEVVYDLVAPDGGLFKVSAIFQAPGVAPEPKTVTGDFGPYVEPGRNRRFVWDAGADWPDNVNSNFTCTVSAEEQSDGSGGVQLWEGGPYWAECNVGASKPEEYGLYFMWGDTVGHAGDWTYDHSQCPTYYKSHSELQSMGYTDSTGNLTAVHDAATAHLGAPWRMPTDGELSGLIKRCTSVWMMRNGVYGRLVIGKGTYASRQIFLPAAGHSSGNGLNGVGGYSIYWSSTPDSYPLYAWGLECSSSGIYGHWGYSRANGFPIRPVRGFAK